MKLVLSLATALLFSFSALATEAKKPIEITVNPGSAQAVADQYYSYDFGVTGTNFPLYTDFTLNNHGPGPLLINSIAIGGVDFNAYYNCPSVLPAQNFCTIRVRFQPWNEGFKTGRLLIRTNDGLIQIALSGWGRRY